MTSDLIETNQDSDFQGMLSETELANLKQNKDVCTNCGTHLNGKFCHGCGQPSRSIIKFFGQVVIDVFDDVIGYDSRLKHTVVPLLFKPGKITNDYIKGRVFHYVLPVRLYLILSVICILMVQAITDPKKMITDDVTFSSESKNQQDIEKELQTAQKILDESGVKVDLRSKLAAREEAKKAKLLPQADNTENNSIRNNSAENDNKINDDEELEKAAYDKKSFSVGLGSGLDTNNENSESVGYFNFDFDDKTNSFNFEGDFYRDYPEAKSAVIDIYNKSKTWKEDPTPLVNQLFELFPFMMFIILPLFAIVLKFTYIFKKRYYVEHLVFCLHNHCFIYFALILEILLNLLEKSLLQYDFWLANFIGQLAGFASVGLGFWIVIYIAIALKRVYRQGWFLTMTKMMFLSLIYFSFLLFGFVTTLIIGAWQA